jgi:hypothetical protein
MLTNYQVGPDHFCLNSNSFREVLITGRRLLPTPLRITKTGKNNLNEEITLLLPDGMMLLHNIKQHNVNVT